MKTNISRYVLASEILIIILFHTVKIKQAEKHPAETSFTRSYFHLTLPVPVEMDKSGFEFMMEKLIR